MKNLLTLIITVLFFTSCEKTPNEKANELIDNWMSQNIPEATYKPVKYLSPIDYTKEEELMIDSLRIAIDSARLYSSISINKDNVHEAFANNERLNSISNSLNEASERMAMEATRIAKENLETYLENNKPEILGEKGYKIRITYMKDKQVMFYIDKDITTIENVEYSLE